MLLKFENVKENEWYTDDDKNIQKLLQISLLLLFFFLLFHIQGGGLQVLLNTWEILAKDLFFDKISGLQPANAIKRSSSKVVLKDFA